MSITVVLDGIEEGALEALRESPTIVELLSALDGDIKELQKLAVDLGRGRCEYDLWGADPAQLTAFLVHPELVGFECCLTAQCKLDKAWAGIHYLLTGKDPFVREARQGPLEWAVMGDAELAGTGLSSPPKVLTPRQVREAAKALAGISTDSLLERFDPEEMRRLDIYPQNLWRQPDAWDYIVEYYQSLREFYEEATSLENGILCR